MVWKFQLRSTKKFTVGGSSQPPTTFESRTAVLARTSLGPLFRYFALTSYLLISFYAGIVNFGMEAIHGHEDLRRDRHETLHC